MNKQEQLQEIFDYYKEQPDRSSQEMVVALLRELQEVQGYISPQLKEQVLELTGVKETFLVSDVSKPSRVPRSTRNRCVFRRTLWKEE